MQKQFIKSPLNYIGGKYRILPQIVPLLPHKIGCFVDLFAGGMNVCLNVRAEKIIANDNLLYLMDLYRALQNRSFDTVLSHILQRIEEYQLSLENEAGYKKLRARYNSERNPLDLLVLVFYSFNHQIRFNTAHDFNNPFGRGRSRYNPHIEQNLKCFMAVLHSANIEFQAKDFHKFDFSMLKQGDLVYCDPPYLISTGAYNDGKRVFGGWNCDSERALLAVLDTLSARGISFALSNVLTHKGKVNTVLTEWLENRPYSVTEIVKDYSNSNYQLKIRDKTATREVFIANYLPVSAVYSLPLFQQAG